MSNSKAKKTWQTPNVKSALIVDKTKSSSAPPSTPADASPPGAFPNAYTS